MLTTGRVVLSLRGRDKDSFFVVTKVEGGYCWLADGRERPLARPKRKNPKHLRPTGWTVELHEAATDRQLRRRLRELTGAADKEPD